jgi:hypothetical protein
MMVPRHRNKTLKITGRKREDKSSGWDYNPLYKSQFALY